MLECIVIGTISSWDLKLRKIISIVSSHIIHRPLSWLFFKKKILHLANPGAVPKIPLFYQNWRGTSALHCHKCFAFPLDKIPSCLMRQMGICRRSHRPAFLSEVVLTVHLRPATARHLLKENELLSWQKGAPEVCNCSGLHCSCESLK